MIRWLDKAEMKLVYITKYAILGLSLLFLGLATKRYISVNAFDNVALFGAISSLMYFIFVWRLNRLIKLSAGTLSAFQVKIMLMYLCRISLAPLFIYCVNNKDVTSSIIIVVLFLVTILGDVVFRYLDMKQNPVPLNSQGSQINDKNETK